MSRAVAVLLTALALTGCNRGESQEDRTLRKLKEAAQQPGPMGPLPNQTPTEHLADVAAGQEAPGVRPLGVADAQTDAGPLHFQATGATEQEAVGVGEMKITSDTPFVRVELLATNDSGEPIPLHFEDASLAKGSTRTAIAPDAQHLVGTRGIDQITVEPHGSKSLVLLFEAPARQPPFVLNLPKPGGGEVQLPLK